jgi:hypothetical protein
VRGAVGGIALLVALAMSLSCGGAPPNWEHRIQKKNDISSLMAQIGVWRREAGLNINPSPQDVIQIQRGGSSVQQLKAVCPDGHTVNESCADVCTLADHICDNAESICNIAAELGEQDTWAQEKCASAKASCREAKKKCCTKCSQAKATW